MTDQSLNINDDKPILNPVEEIAKSIRITPPDETKTTGVGAGLITKKVAAFEVVKELRQRLFLFMGALGTLVGLITNLSFNTISSVALVANLGICIWGIITSVRKIKVLKEKYGL